nr:hypothetical protein [Nocardioides humi]
MPSGGVDGGGIEGGIEGGGTGGETDGGGVPGYGGRVGSSTRSAGSGAGARGVAATTSYSSAGTTARVAPGAGGPQRTVIRRSTGYSVTRSSSTYVPNWLPLSTSTQPYSVAWSSACWRETEPAVSTTSASMARPIR